MAQLTRFSFSTSFSVPGFACFPSEVSLATNGLFAIASRDDCDNAGALELLLPCTTILGTWRAMQKTMCAAPVKRAFFCQVGSHGNIAGCVVGFVRLERQEQSYFIFFPFMTDSYFVRGKLPF